MKNDFREFYDEDYIMHSMTEEELMHGEWANKFTRFVDKVRTKSGKWRYIYPEDLKKAANNLKRDVSYAARNVKSKITGKNERFKDTSIGTLGRDAHLENINGRPTLIKTKKTIPGAYAEENKKASSGMKVYNRRKQQLSAAKANQMYYDQTAQRHAKKEATKRASMQRHASIAGQKYYDKGSSAYKSEIANNKMRSAVNEAKAIRERRERQTKAYNANRKYYDKSLGIQQKKKEAEEWNTKMKKRRGTGSHRG